MSATPLIRGLDRRGARHTYAAGAFPSGTPVGVLGRLAEAGADEGLPLWITASGRVHTDGYRPVRGRPTLRQAARWTLSPLRFGEEVGAPRRLGLVLARAPHAARRLLFGWGAGLGGRRPPAPAGYLRATPAPGWEPLFVAQHPVTGDQLLTRWPAEAEAAGYDRPAALGHIAAPERADGAWSAPDLRWAWKLGRPGARVRAPAGGFEPGVAGGEVRGWVAAPEPMRIHLDLGATCVAAETTDADGAFAAAVPRPCFEAGVHALHVVCARTGRRLSSAPLVIRRALPGDPLRCAVQRLDLNLAVEGWVWDAEAPDERFTVTVFIDHRRIGQTPARDPRPDLERAGHGDGRIGYRMDIPRRYLDGREHVVHVLVDERATFSAAGAVPFGRAEAVSGLVRRMGRRLERARALTT